MGQKRVGWIYRLEREGERGGGDKERELEFGNLFCKDCSFRFIQNPNN